jgi:hypothetical protein
VAEIPSFSRKAIAGSANGEFFTNCTRHKWINVHARVGRWKKTSQSVNELKELRLEGRREKICEAFLDVTAIK